MNHFMFESRQKFQRPKNPVSDRRRYGKPSRGAIGEEKPPNESKIRPNGSCLPMESWHSPKAGVLSRDAPDRGSF